MPRYIEVKTEIGKRMLVKLDTIRTVEERLFSSVSPKTLCTIDGRNINMHYEDIKKLLNDERRSSILDDTVDFRVAFLMTYGIWDIIKEFPGENARLFMRAILNARSQDEMWKLAREAVDNMEALGNQ